MANPDAVVAIVQSLVDRLDRGEVKVTLETFLFSDEEGNGLGLDSLEAAELSALLEDEHGNDPFSEGELPETVQEIVDFYGA